MTSFFSIAEELSQSWEAQQSCHIRFREDRFNIMLDYIGSAFGDAMNGLDIACGTGSISRRFIERFPGSTITSIDHDPVLLKIGKETVPDPEGRIEWKDIDLRTGDWSSKELTGKYNCGMSSTALHWLDEKSLESVYRNIYNVLDKGGVFMNCDHMISESRDQSIAENVHKSNERWSRDAFLRTGAYDWDLWWKEVERCGAFNDLLAERRRRYPEPDNHNQMVPLEKHVEFMKKAGFSGVNVIWQYGNDRILIGVK